MSACLGGRALGWRRSSMCKGVLAVSPGRTEGALLTLHTSPSLLRYPGEHPRHWDGGTSFSYTTRGGCFLSSWGRGDKPRWRANPSGGEVFQHREGFRALVQLERSGIGDLPKGVRCPMSSSLWVFFLG